MGHREVDLTHTAPRGPGADAAAQPDGGLGPADDFDVLPREGARNAEPERLPHGLPAGEAARTAHGRVRSRLAVRLLGSGEAAVAETGVALERASDPRDLDQVGTHAHHR